MLMISDYIDVKYIGEDNIRISDYEKARCCFYALRNKKDTENQKLYIMNKDYFILNSCRRKRNKERLIVSFDNEQIITVFNDELIINDEKIKSVPKRVINEEVKDNFLYLLSAYYVRNEDIESAKTIIAQTGDVYLYYKIENINNIEDKKEVLSILHSCVDDQMYRYKNGQSKIMINEIYEEPQCLIEVLNEIKDDGESVLLWDYSYNYNRVSTKNTMVEDDYIFIRPKVGYGKVSDIVIGSQKLNIGLRVKVDGEVIDRKTNLKLDSHIFREYNVVLNGKLNTAFIWCKLSVNLKKKYKRQNIIKSISNIFGEEIITIDLNKMKITNNRVLGSMDIETIAESLNRIDELMMKQRILNRLSKEVTSINTNKEINNYPDNISEILKNYRVDENGTYHPLSTSKDIEQNNLEVYLERVLEWKVERVNRKQTESTFLNDYEVLIKDGGQKSFANLYDEYKKVKSERAKLEYQVNIIRISCGILSRSIFIWEDEIEKEKKETDSLLNINAVVGGKVKISSKNVKDIKIKQYSYRIISKCS